MLPMTTTAPRTTLVLGSNGKTGSRIARQLADRGLGVRAGSRSATPAFDWEDRSTWAAAVDGVDAVYISYFPDLAVPTAPEAVEAFARVAADAGVRRAVLLSGRGEPEAQRSEELVRAVLPQTTIVRCAWFDQNFSESYFRDMVMDGVLAVPVSDVREPFVDADDIADVAVAALTDDRHAGQLYELTGPRMLTFAEAVAEIAAASGRAAQVVTITDEEFVAGLEAEGLPRDLVALIRFLFAEVLDGRNEFLTDGVERALGRPPRDFSAFAREAAANGAWSA